MWAYNNTVNITLQEMLQTIRGPKHLPPGAMAPISFIMTMVFVFGVVGNFAVTVYIATDDSAFRKATDYYLFSQAISHLMLLFIGLPTELAVYWDQYPWPFGVGFCKFRAFIFEMSMYASILSMVAFSFERYIVICHRVRSHTMSGLSSAIRIISVLWIVSLIGAIPFAVFTNVNYIDFPPGSNQTVPESAVCSMFEDNIPYHWPAYEISALFFLIPMCVIVFLYVRLRQQMHMTSMGRSVDGTVHGETNQSQGRMSIIRMLFAVVIIYFLCWVPFHTHRLLYVYGRKSPYNPQIKEWFYYISGCLCYFSSILNPIFCNILYVRYRDAFQQSHCRHNRNHRELNPNVHATELQQRNWQRPLTRIYLETPTMIKQTVTPRNRCYTSVATSVDEENNVTLPRVTVKPDETLNVSDQQVSSA